MLILRVRHLRRLVRVEHLVVPVQPPVPQFQQVIKPQVLHQRLHHVWLVGTQQEVQVHVKSAQQV
jgi:hypothetical protein